MDIHEQILELKKPYLKEIQCLDKGFCKLVDWCGSDSRIVQAARVSYGKGTKTINEDKGLIDYLVRNFHTSPIEQVSFTFHEKMPVFVARQQVRHRTAKLNEISGRYSILVDQFYVPDADRMQKQSVNNKQGSSMEVIDDVEAYLDKIEAEQQEIYKNYEEYLETGLAKELARINLPVSIYTEWYWTIDAHNLFHYLRLRLDEHAQKEVRAYAQAKYDLIKPIIPYTCEAFEKHILYGHNFSKDEIDVIRELLPDKENMENLLKEKGFKKTHIAEFMKKIS